MDPAFSQKVREILSQHPDWRREDVVAALQVENGNQALALLNLMKDGKSMSTTVNSHSRKRDRLQEENNNFRYFLLWWFVEEP